MNSNQTRFARFARGTSRVAANVGLAAVILVALGFVIPGLMGFERYVITGGSMSGTFERGSVAFERLTPVSELEVGDVITYQPPVESGLTTLVTHRIVSIKETRQGQLLFHTKGDANEDADPWKFVLPEGQQPQVEVTVPVVGFAFMAIADRETRMLLVVVPAGLVCLLGLLDLVRMVPAARRRGTAADPVVVEVPAVDAPAAPAAVIPAAPVFVPDVMPDAIPVATAIRRPVRQLQEV
jgi:signal peptidase